jgi:hypothetical protein
MVFAPARKSFSFISKETNEKSEKNRFIRLKHNRFNLVFVLGYAVYYHHEDISIFLDTVHGTKNDLLKAGRDPKTCPQEDDP